LTVTAFPADRNQLLIHFGHVPNVSSLNGF
jgi:hypothetical protein